jgi:hypothetical protein
MSLDDPTRQEPSIEFAILADAVQASAGKLFILGGGWDTLFVRSFPARHPSLGIALRLRVPWTRAGDEITLVIDLENEDGVSIFGDKKLTHAFVTKPPTGFPEGSDMGVVRAFTFNNVPLPTPGSYAFVLSLDGEDRHRLRFFVRPRPPSPAEAE